MDIIEQKTRDNIEFFAGYWTVLDVCKRGLGGDGGIRTLDSALGHYNGLANRRLQPLGHVSNSLAYNNLRCFWIAEIFRLLPNLLPNSFCYPIREKNIGSIL